MTFLADYDDIHEMMRMMMKYDEDVVNFFATITSEGPVVGVCKGGRVKKLKNKVLTWHDDTMVKKHWWFRLFFLMLQFSKHVKESFFTTVLFSNHKIEHKTNKFIYIKEL